MSEQNLPSPPAANPQSGEDCVLLENVGGLNLPEPDLLPAPDSATSSGEEAFFLEEVGDLEAVARAAFADEARSRSGRLASDNHGAQFPDLLAEGEAPQQRVVGYVGERRARPGVAQTPFFGGTLGQLREQAQSLLEQREARARLHYQHAAQLDRSLRQVFAYLHDMVQQLNVVQPDIPRDYSLVGGHSLHTLSWQQGYADFRTSSMSSDQAFMEIVTLSYRLTSHEQPIVLERDAHMAEVFRQRLFDFNLNMRVQEIRDVNNLLESVRITIAPEVRVSVRWEPDYEKGALLVHAHNLERLGYITYRLPTDAPMNPALLEEFARMTLGLPHHFPHIAHRPA